MSLGPLGMSGGMDINSMVSKIVDAERVPKQQSINNERTTIDASISAYGRLRESLDTMKNLMANFRQEKAFAARTVETTDDKVVSATATTDAIAGKYAVDVLQLAQSHKIASDVLPDDAKFGPGKLHISLGEAGFVVKVSSNSKLVDVVRGINGAKNNPGVRASLINDVDGPRLILASDLSGEDHQIRINVDAEQGNPLKKFAYQTLEDRVKALEEARTAAEEVLGPLRNPQQADESDLLDESGNPLPPSMQSLKDNSGEQDVTSNAPVSASGAAAAKAGQEALDKANERASWRPEDRIPGWTETASGTLLDSYEEPELELDEKAIAKAPDVPGWSNAASGTLTDSYVTTKEAKQLLDQEKADIEQKIADEKQELDAKVERGELTEEQAKQIQRAKLTPEERERLDKIESAEAKIAQAQTSFEGYLGMTEVQAGQNSVVLLDGVAKLSSNNNVIEDAIEGVDLTLKGKSDPNQRPAEIGVEYDRQGVRSDIENFVAAYNSFYQTSQALASVDPLTGQKGPLAGDSTVRSADSRLKSVFSTRIDKAPEHLKSLTEFGITTTRQGTLEINYNMLDRQLNNNFNELEKFFGGNTGFAKRIEDAIQGITGVTGSIRTREKSLTEQNYRLNDAQVTLDRRMESLEKRTHDKFSAMQDATGKMQGQLGALMSALG
ncbi:morphogenesis and for the elongation of the flagellar filament by facilitating polymerization of the flagellin monomers at the tip of growing filament. Forms a capping structure [Vibrio sp. B1FLJ16]|uniref:flagellar filament capping protein FliD n=1 Tax=Vibrio sp. B1FLJ16 TaxID=2751178 RepID=UPI0015F710E2|nr:flagellar filament capping protein FliD [Vibrio sp. B1FLJ16]CAD7809350.1 morphogenesis and for the elongation of the flagellar filament by facilitating polymerization of the flagellin monomers at the tip of growing filament. Forms a capping structure [Vibrio sp. B1FLJ16]CAE6909374.1 morphogenesis and for the elongation of the flagellar filament by facilitating polymerization of the flagellin monomers at the tip of growing filament. Forms a capping structure [Vibrio sp. B1FLJ16]